MARLRLRLAFVAAALVGLPGCTSSMTSPRAIFPAPGYYVQVPANYGLASPFGDPAAKRW